MFDFLIGYVAGERTAARAATYARSAGASSAGQTTAELMEVNNRVDRLLLVVDAMWSLLRESGWTDAQLRQRIEDLDSSDGLMDGRRTPLARQCPKCAAMVGAERSTCAFCGADMPTEPGVLDSI